MFTSTNFNPYTFFLSLNRCALMCAILVCLRCDECLLCYHFGCLDPPLKKSPKQTGYGWICQECDTSSSKVSAHGRAAFL